MYSHYYKRIALVISSAISVSMLMSSVAFAQVEFTEEPDLNTTVTAAPDAPSSVANDGFPGHAELGGKMYFFAPSPDAPATLYSIDSSNEISQLSDSNSNFSEANRLVAFKGDLYFIATATDGYERLWKYEVSTADYSIVSGDGFSIKGTYIRIAASDSYIFILAENNTGGASFYRYDGSANASEFLNLNAALDSDSNKGSIDGFATSGDKLVFQFDEGSVDTLYAADASKQSVPALDLVTVGTDSSNTTSRSVEGVVGDDILIRLWVTPNNVYGRGFLPNNDAYSFADGIPDVKRIETNGSFETEGLYPRDGGLVRVDFDNFDAQLVTTPDPAIPWEVTATSGDLTPNQKTNGSAIYRHEVGGNVYLSEYDRGSPGKYLLSAADKSYLEAESSQTGEFISRPFAFNGLIWFQNNWGSTATLEGVDPTDPSNMSKRVEKTLVANLVQTRSDLEFGFENGPVVFQDESTGKYSYKFNSGSAQELQISDIEYLSQHASTAPVEGKYYFSAVDANFYNLMGVITDSTAAKLSMPPDWDLSIGSDFVAHNNDLYFLGTSDGDNRWDDDFLFRVETSDDSISQVMSESDIPNSTEIEKIFSAGDYLYAIEESNKEQLWRLDSSLSGSSITMNDGVNDVLVQDLFELDGQVYVFGCYLSGNSNCDSSEQYFWSLDFDTATLGSAISSTKLLGLQGDTVSRVQRLDIDGAVLMFPKLSSYEGRPRNSDGNPVLFDGSEAEELETGIYFPIDAIKYNKRFFAIGKLDTDKFGPWRLLELVDTGFVSVAEFKTTSSGFRPAVAAGRLYFQQESFTIGRKVSSLSFDDLSVVKTYAGNAESGTADGLQSYSSSSVLIPSNSGNLSKSGKSFTGWNTQADGNGDDYTVGEQVSGVGLLRLYPKFTEAQFTLSFDTSSADTGSVDSVTGSGIVDVPWPTDLEKTDKTFAGWNTEADGDGASYLQGSSFNLDENTTLYAQWADVEESSPSPSPSPSPSFAVSTPMTAMIVNDLLVIQGSNLNLLDEVHVNGLDANILTKARAFALVNIPEAASTNDYNLDLFRNGQKFTQLEVESELGLTSQEYGDSSAWTKRISDTQAKVYVKYPTIGSKVRILHQTGGSGSYTSIFAKTIEAVDDSALRVVPGVGSYIVRTVDLADINRIRVRIDDEQIWKVRYNR
jgi:hypothetical protein